MTSTPSPPSPPTSSRLAGLCWATAAPLFLLANVVVGNAWSDPGFDWRVNNISDLGNVTCGIADPGRPRYVCSPWHAGMNTAFVVTGLLLVAGTALTWRTLGRGARLRVGQLGVALGGAGLALAGLYPGDVDENRHFLAALLVFVVGNLGLLLVGTARGPLSPARARRAALVAGLVGTVGTVLFFARVGPLIGIGGMERVAAFPLQLWAYAVGASLLLEPAGPSRRPDDGPGEPAADGRSGPGATGTAGRRTTG